MGKLLLHIVSATLGLFLASMIVPGVTFSSTYLILILIGTVLGLINFFIKPILKAISIPIMILTLGLSSLIINMAMVWLVDIIFPLDIEINGIIPLFFTTLIIWILSFILGIYKK
jgi:putative membrane protein